MRGLSANSVLVQVHGHCRALSKHMCTPLQVPCRLDCCRSFRAVAACSRATENGVQAAVAESLAERLSSSNSASTSAAVPDVNFTIPQLAFLSRKGLHDSRGAVMLKNLTFLELEDWCESNAERRQRARQLWRWLYADGALIRHIDEATGVANGFSSAFLCAPCPASLYLSSQLDCCYTCEETSAGLSLAAPPLLAPVGRSCTATLDSSVMCLSSCKPLPLVSSPLRTLLREPATLLNSMLRGAGGAALLVAAAQQETPLCGFAPV